MLNRIDHRFHPVHGVHIAVVGVAVAVGGGRGRCGCMIGALKCHSVALCVTRPSGLVRLVVAWEVARGFLFQIDVTAIVIVTPL